MCLFFFQNLLYLKIIIVTWDKNDYFFYTLVNNYRLPRCLYQFIVNPAFLDKKSDIQMNFIFC